MPIANRSCNEPIRPQRPRIRTHNNHRSKQCSAEVVAAKEKGKSDKKQEITLLLSY